MYAVLSAAIAQHTLGVTDLPLSLRAPKARGNLPYKPFPTSETNMVQSIKRIITVNKILHKNLKKLGGSGIISSMNTEIKIINSNNSFYHLKEIADVQVGYQARERIEMDSNGEYKIINSQDFDEFGNYQSQSVNRFNPFEHIDPEKYLIIKDDLLFQARGNAHCTFWIKENVLKTVAASTFYIIRINGEAKVLPSYLLWWLNQSKTQAYFERQRGVSTISFVSKKNLEETRVVLPSFQVQRTIGELFTLQNIEKNLYKKLVDRKEMLIQAAAQWAVEEKEVI